jgi:TonB-dependent starch-binding outer membrane protein SusC
MKKNVRLTPILWKIMRFTINQIMIIAFFSCLAFGHNAKGQEVLLKKVSLKTENLEMRTVLRLIEKQANVKFMYSAKIIQANQKISLDIYSENLESVLKQMLTPLSISYEIFDNRILLKKKPIENTVTPILSVSTPKTIKSEIEQTVKGIVTDVATGEGLPNASVVVKGTTQGTITDVDGTFTIAVPDDKSVLIFSYVGYETQEILVGTQTVINVSLKEGKSLSEVVVVGYGTTTKNKLTTAITSVNSATIEKLSITRVEQALQGNAPGVLILNQNGQPGDKPMIRIRGTGTNGNPDPLFVVDGFPVSSIENLNPSDIERMDVLKDAAASAIYGARGANGVILITTKTGKRGSASVTYNGYMGQQTAWRTVPVLNATDYATLMNESYTNVNPTGTALPYPNPSQYGVGTNWQNELFQKNVPIQSHQVTASGGSDKATYLASFSYFDQQGIIGGKNSEFKRYTFRLNMDQNVTDYLKIGTNLNYVFGVKNAIGDNFDQGGSVLGHAFNLDPITPVYETDPNKLTTYNVNAVKNGSQVYGISPQATFPNPLAQLAILNGDNKNDKLFGNVYADLTIWKGLKFKSTFGADLANNTSKSLVPIYFLLAGSGQTFSKINSNFSRSYTWQTENVLSYSTDIGKHNIEALVGQSALKFTFENLSGSRNDPSPVDPNLGYIDVATDVPSSTNGGGADARALSSYFGRLSYGFDGKYLVSGVLRRDGSSRFGRNFPFAIFPSASAAWVVSKESFFKTNLISLLKLRGSWGQNGNENIGGSFPWASTIGFGGQQYTFLDKTGAEVFVSGASLGRIANPFLKWETSEQTDAGIDIGFFNGKLTLTADYYIKTTKDLLIAPDVPASVGFPAPFVNGGSVENKGIELGINYNDKIGKDLGINVSFNISHNNNKVIAINNIAKVVAGAAYINMGSITRMTVGEPIGYFWGQTTAGIFQTAEEVTAYNWVNPTTSVSNLIQPNAKPGDLKFIDTNNDGRINDLDRVNIGDPNPKYITGFTLNLDYKGFDFSAMTVGMFGHQVFNGTYRFDKAISNLPEKWLNRWTPSNTATDIPRFVAGSANFSTVSNFYLEDGSFVRVKNLQLGYTLPTSLTSKAKINTLRLYVSLDNAFTFTKYTGFDPELGATGPLSLGIDRGVYPQAKTLRFGLSLKL